MRLPPIDTWIGNPLLKPEEQQYDQHHYTIKSALEVLDVSRRHTRNNIDPGWVIAPLRSVFVNTAHLAKQVIR